MSEKFTSITVTSSDLINFARIYPRFDNAIQFLVWLSHNDLLDQGQIKRMGVSLEEIALQYSSPSQGVVSELLTFFTHEKLDASLSPGE